MSNPAKARKTKCSHSKFGIRISFELGYFVIRHLWVLRRDHQLSLTPMPHPLVVVLLDSAPSIL